MTGIPGRIYPDRIFWISDVFPRPFLPTDGVWSLKTALALRKKGVEVSVLSPSPWVPKCMGWAPKLARWTDVPGKVEMEGMPVFYPKCPHYPDRSVRAHVYNNIPFLETKAIYRWVEDTVADILKKFPVQVIHANYMFPSGYIGYRIKEKYGIPLVFHERGVRRLDTAIKNARMRRIYSTVVRESDLVIAPNEKMAETIRKNFFCPGNVTVVRDVGDIDIAEGMAEPRPDRYRDKKIILSVGTMIERKGHEVLVDAVGRIKETIPDVKCIIVGSGKRFGKIRARIRDLGLDDIVELRGEIPHSEVLKIMSWCDVFVLASWDEAFGTVNSEAMTFGKPIIGCAGEGISEVITDGVHGFLVEKRNVEQLALAVSKILTDPSLARQMGDRAGELAKKELNYSHITDQMIELYANILS